MTQLIPAPVVSIETGVQAIIQSAPPVPIETFNIMTEALNAVTITSQADHECALILRRDARSAIKTVEEYYDPPKTLLHRLKTSIIDHVKSITGPTAEALAKADRIILKYEADVKRQNEEASRAALAAQAAAEAAAKAAAEDALPWEEPTVVAPVLAPPVPMVATVKVAGVGARKGPAAAEVVDRAKFLAWVMQSEERQAEFIEIKGPALNAKARQLGPEIERFIPGVKFVQEMRLQSR
jgi:hypothetical protein